MGLIREGFLPLYTNVDPSHLHSFPTRRSSDLLRSMPWIGTAQRERKPFKSWMRTPARSWIRGAFPASPMACTWIGTLPLIDDPPIFGRRGTMPWSVGRFSDRRVADREHPFARE